MLDGNVKTDPIDSGVKVNATENGIYPGDEGKKNTVIETVPSVRR